MTHPPTPPEPADADRPRAAHASIPLDDFGPLDDDEELSEELTPEDEMWLAITDYVSGHATAEEAAVVEARMAGDPAYAKLVAEVRAIWALPFDRILTGKEAAPGVTAVPTTTALPSPAFEAPMTPTTPQVNRRQRALWGVVGVAVVLVVAFLAMQALGR